MGLESKLNENISASNLNKIVKERVQKIQKIDDFVHYVTTKLGEMLEHEQGNSNSKYVWSLDDFYGFRMYFDHGKVSYYGNSTQLTYNGKVVFEIKYEGSFENDDNSEVVTYKQGEWEEKIKPLIKNKGKLVAEILSKRMATKDRRTREAMEKKQKDKLLAKAKRLGL